MSEEIKRYKGRHTGREIDDLLDKVPVLQQNITRKVDANSPITANSSSMTFARWDAKGLVTGAGNTAYNTRLTFNGTEYGNVLRTNAAALPSFYAPTTAGTKGQVLVSNGAGTAPSWATLSPPDTPGTPEEPEEDGGIILSSGSVTQVMVSISGTTGQTITFYVFPILGFTLSADDIVIESSKGGQTFTNEGRQLKGSVRFSCEVKSAKSEYIWARSLSRGYLSNRAVLNITGGPTMQPKVYLLGARATDGSNTFVRAVIDDYNPSDLTVSWKLNGAATTQGAYLLDNYLEDGRTYCALAMTQTQYKSMNTISPQVTHQGSTVEAKIVPSLTDSGGFSTDHQYGIFIDNDGKICIGNADPTKIYQSPYAFYALKFPDVAGGQIVIPA